MGEGRELDFVEREQGEPSPENRLTDEWLSLSSQNQPPLRAERFGRLFEEKFSAFDLDNDQRITKEEVKKSLAAMKTKDEVYSAATIIEKRFNDLSRMTPDGANLSRADAREFRYRVDPTAGFNQKLRATTIECYSEGLILTAGVTMGAEGTMVLGAAATLDPEPTTKTVATNLTRMAAQWTRNVAALQVRTFATPSVMKNEYLAEQRRLKAWSEFTR